MTTTADSLRPAAPLVRAVWRSLRGLHAWLVRPPAGLDPQYTDFYPLSNYVHGMGLVAHISFLLLFLAFGVPWLAAFNVLSVGVFGFTFWLSRQGRLNPALLLGGVEVVCHQAAVVITIGLGAGFQNYVLVLVMGTLFYSHIDMRVRVVMAIVPVLFYLLIQLYGLYLPPQIALAPEALAVLSMMNAVLFISILMGMAIYFQYAVARARDRAERMAASKTLFLANMSHELRTPLNAILGFAQILARSDELSAPHRAKLTSINRSGQHLLSLINRILDMSKLEQGKLELQTAPFDLDQLLDEVRDMFSLSAIGKGLSLMLQRSPELPAVLDGDALRLRQILINLVGNAVKFTAQGSVVVSVTRARQQAQHGLRLRFEVQDSGIGISRTERADLFQIFTQTESGRQSGQGTGLGLALSRRIAELMDGEMGVLSKPGRGSLFWFEVQLRPAVGAPGVSAAAHTPGADFVPALDLPQEPEAVALRELRQWPHDTLLRLHAAVELADYDSTDQLLHALEQHPPGPHPWLRQLLAQYRFDRLLALAEQALQSTPSQLSQLSQPPQP